MNTPTTPSTPSKTSSITLLSYEAPSPTIAAKLRKALSMYSEGAGLSVTHLSAFFEYIIDNPKIPLQYLVQRYEEVPSVKERYLQITPRLRFHLINNLEGTLPNPQDSVENSYNVKPSNYYNDTLQDYKSSSKYRQVIEQLSAEWATPFNTTQEKLIDKTFTENPNIPGYAVLELIKEEYESITKEQQPIKPHFFNKKASEPAQDVSLPTNEPSLRERLFHAVRERNEGKLLTSFQIKELNEGFRYMMDQNIHSDSFDKQVEFLYDCIL